MSSAPGAILWLTGLPRAGKSTLARAVGARVASVRAVEILDSDITRPTLSPDLGYSKEDRNANILRIGFVARLLARHGVFVIAAAISPYTAAREEVRRRAESEGIAFIEVFANASIHSLAARAGTGIYQRALAGEIQHFTGVSDPYEPPRNPDIEVRTDVESVAESVEKVVRLLVGRGLLVE